MIHFYILIFIASLLTLFASGTWLVRLLMKIARYLGWKEYVLAFFAMAFAASLPNLFIGINAAFQGVPQLSFGDVIGGNIVDLTLAIALAVLIGGSTLSVESSTVEKSTMFTAGIAILPILLILDGNLGRGDALILLFAFAFYMYWLFSKSERFKEVYTLDDSLRNDLNEVKEFRSFLKDLASGVVALVLVLLAAYGAVNSALFFVQRWQIHLATVGIFIVGLGNAIPEIDFAIAAARKGETRMILGDLMGSVIVAATLVLGIVALIQPIKIIDFSMFALARIFMIISALLFFFLIRTDRKITKKEALLLLLIYFSFVAAEAITK